MRAQHYPFRAVAHELLNPPTPLRGGMETIAHDRTGYAVRDRLLDIVRRQSVRLEWLIRAAVADPSPVARPTMFDASVVIRESAALAGAECGQLPVLAVHADEESFRLAMEAVLMAMTRGGCAAVVDATRERLRVTSACRAIEDTTYHWKMKLARGLLHGNDIALRVRTTDGGSVATMSFRSLRVLRSVT